MLRPYSPSRIQASELIGLAHSASLAPPASEKFPRPLQKRAIILRLIARVVACAAVLALPAIAAGAAVLQPADTPVTIPSLAPWTGKDGKPGLDAWSHAAHFSIDYEVTPGHNLPAPVKTDVYVGYTQTALWLHFIAHDPYPVNIHAKYRQHDDVPIAADYVGVIFSPFNDTLWAYQFVCSAGGTEYDEFRQQDNEYPSWDAIWYCRAHLTATGYTVTMQIPFHSLSLPQISGSQTWRLILERNWPRSVRYKAWQVKWDYNRHCEVCDAQVVHSQTPVHSEGGNFLFIPTATEARTDSRPAAGSPMVQGNPNLSGGFDAQWAIRPDLTWSGTLSPDFSQVAPDVLQSSVNQRFTLFYPENRPFFDQGTQIFNTPGLNFGPFGAGSNNQLTDTLQIAEPRWASKLIGQVGDHVLGALVADDQITNILLPGAQASSLQSFNFPTTDAQLRYRYDFANNSTLGVLATGRSGSGYANDMYSADGSWQLDPSDLMTIQAAHSTTTYPRAVAQAFDFAPGQVTGSSWMTSLARTRSNYKASLSVGQIDPGFRADLGYLPQVGYNQAQGRYEYDWYSHTAWWNTGGFGAGYYLARAADSGLVLGREAQVYAFVDAIGQSTITLYTRQQEQYVGDQSFSFGQGEVKAITQPWRWLQFGVDATGGGGVDNVGVRKGQLLSVAPSFTLAPGPHLNVSFVGNFQRLDIGHGRLYTADLYDLRIAWYFNSQMFVRVIGQEQDIRRNVALYPAGEPGNTRQLATQLLFGYVLNPWTSFYAGTTDGYAATDSAGLIPLTRSYFLKISYAFQF